MPYITKAERSIIDEHVDGLHWEVRGIGHLNYAITKFCVAYIGRDKSYEMFNAVIGVLESAKQELYRRMIAPYEDEKCAANGDVY